MTVLEPSAGTGNIAVLARLAGANVDTNEIDDRRRELLSLQGFEPTAFDAERLDNLLPPEKSYHAIVMNPPFSATGGRVNGHRTAFGARHIEQAPLRLKPGGRLVAIVGCGYGRHINTHKARHVNHRNSCLPDLAETGSMAPNNCTGSGSPGRDDPRSAPVSTDPGSIGLSRPGSA